mgnify:FL=1
METVKHREYCYNFRGGRDREVKFYCYDNTVVVEKVVLDYCTRMLMSTFFEDPLTISWTEDGEWIGV